MQHACPEQDLTDLILVGARYGDLEDMEQALAQGVEVDRRDEQGRTGEQCMQSERNKFLLCV